jgi:hypothetical protein
MNETINSGTTARETRAFNDIKTIGRTWARYGLNVGKMALESSATTLQKTAALLSNLAETLAPEDQPKRSDAASEDQPKSPTQAE